MAVEILLMKTGMCTFPSRIPANEDCRDPAHHLHIPPLAQCILLLLKKCTRPKGKFIGNCLRLASIIKRILKLTAVPLDAGAQAQARLDSDYMRILAGQGDAGRHARGHVAPHEHPPGSGAVQVKCAWCFQSGVHHRSFINSFGN
jgi:hypothetical protein